VSMLKSFAAVAALALTAAPAHTRPAPKADTLVLDDADRLAFLGESAVRLGWARAYKVTWLGNLELTISSPFISDARTIAAAVCGSSRAAGYHWRRERELRVYNMTPSNRPVAVCKLAGKSGFR